MQQEDCDYYLKTYLDSDWRYFTGIIFNALVGANLIFSPITIHAALNMVLLGTKSTTSTANDLRMVLFHHGASDNELIHTKHLAYSHAIKGFREISKPALEALEKNLKDPPDEESEAKVKLPLIEMLNLILVDPIGGSLRESYSRTISNYYNATVKVVPKDKPEEIAKISAEISKWGKKAGFDNDILVESEILNIEAAMLFSAVRVQAFWHRGFNERKTKIFHNFGLKNKPVNGTQLFQQNFNGKFVEFCKLGKSISRDQLIAREHYEKMESLFKSESDIEDLVALNFRAAVLPLVGHLDFVVFEPINQGKGVELMELSKKLFSKKSYHILTRALQFIDEQNETTIIFDSISLPKFNFESDIDLKEPLKAIGLEDIFDRDNSRISKIIENKSVFVSEAKHQAVIEVNKAGIKAAGATKVQLTPKSALGEVEYNLENPFIFLIRYKQSILFAGRLNYLEVD